MSLERKAVCEHFRQVVDKILGPDWREPTSIWNSVMKIDDAIREKIESLESELKEDLVSLPRARETLERNYAKFAAKYFRDTPLMQLTNKYGMSILAELTSSSPNEIRIAQIVKGDTRSSSSSSCPPDNLYR